MPANPAVPYPHGSLRGFWRFIRRLFGDPVARDKLNHIEARLEAIEEKVHLDADTRTELLRALVREAIEGVEKARAEASRISEVLSVLEALGRGSADAMSRIQELPAIIEHQNGATRQVLDQRAWELREAVQHQNEATRQILDQRTFEVRQAVEHQTEVSRADAMRAHQESKSYIHNIKQYIDELSAQFREVELSVGRLSAQLDGLQIDRWRINELEGLLRYHRRRDYEEAIRSGRLIVPKLDTEHPLAVYSEDTKRPRGSRNDNSVCLRFNRKLIDWLGREHLRVLDIGCAGGGMVRSFLDAGHFAVGLDGSDYPLVNQTGEWGTIPKHLFTCDATKPFRLTIADSGEPLKFDAITAWELMEHIPEELLPGLFANLDAHLEPHGVMTFSIATFMDADPVSGAIYHLCVHPKEWWLERFEQAGFVEATDSPFSPYDWVRGSGHCRGDWTEDEGLGFHVALRRK